MVNETIDLTKKEKGISFLEDAGKALTASEIIKSLKHLIPPQEEYEEVFKPVIKADEIITEWDPDFIEIVKYCIDGVVYPGSYLNKRQREEKKLGVVSAVVDSKIYQRTHTSKVTTKPLTKLSTKPQVVKPKGKR